MRVFRVSFASSITQFAVDRIELDVFIHRLGCMFRNKYNMDIDPFICENFDPALTVGGRMQDEINAEILASDLVVFLFYTKLGDYTKEEFNIATKQFAESKNHKPVVCVHFKKLLCGEVAEPPLEAFHESLRGSGIYDHEPFEHIDTLKFHILLNIISQLPDCVRISTDGESCLVGGQKILSLKNIREFSRLGSVQKERGEDATDMEQQRKEADHILGLCLKMARLENSGSMSSEEKEAYRLLETGDYKAAGGLF